MYSSSTHGSDRTGVIPSTTDPKVLNWGILATGGIALTFARDLTIPPSTRNISDFTHRIVAAASSSSSRRASSFLQSVDADKDGNPRGVLDDDVRAYGSYEELVRDERVQIVYVATPHSHHYQNVRLCLEAGKHVLCEKAFTVNRKQAELLYGLAKEKVSAIIYLDFSIGLQA